MGLIRFFWVTALRTVVRMREPAANSSAVSPSTTTAWRIAVPKLNSHGPATMNAVVL